MKNSRKESAGPGDEAALILKGKKFSFGKEGLTVGSSPHSGVVIAEDTVSKNHAEIKFANGRFLITDLNSTNGTLVNERLIGTAELLEGDRLQIGESPLLFHRRGCKPRRNYKQRFLLVTLGAALLPALLLTVTGKKVKSPTPPTIELIEERGTSGSLVHKETSISPDGAISLFLNDRRQNRCLWEEGMLTKTQMNKLRSVLSSSNFFELSSSYMGGPSEEENLLTIKVSSQGLSKRLFFSGGIPPEIKPLAEQINRLSEEIFSHTKTLPPSSELTGQADNNFRRGIELMSEKKPYYAMEAFDLALRNLETVSEKPSFYNPLKDHLREVQDGLEKAFTEHRLKAERAIRLKRRADAYQHLQAILVLIPEPRDKRNRYARKRLGEIKRH